MNRYRSVPGLGPQKASASTTCQKCLKKGHYSYECKASLQERPYASRPSRSQLFKNPRLAPPLASEKKNDLLNSEGVADKVLADAEAKRAAENEERRSRSPATASKARSRSSSVDSVSTISTNRSKSRSPPQRRNHDSEKRSGRPSSRSPSRSRAPKRRYNSVSSSAPSLSRSPPQRQESKHKNRRHRTVSPDDRGRQHSVRRGSRRSRSGSEDMSVDKSRVTKQRRLMDEDDDENLPPRDEPYSRRGERDSRGKRDEPDRRRGDGHLPGNARGQSGYGRDRDGDLRKERPKERSLSPYSRRLALTQAMNISR